MNLSLRYNQCHHSNLNGPNAVGSRAVSGITWKTWRGERYSLESAKMILKPADAEATNKYEPGVWNFGLY